jgi:acyl carrier protein
MEELTLKLKKQIIEELYLEDIKPEEIDTDLPLFGDGLGLDSIDALSLVVLLDKEYGLKVVDPDEGKAILYSIQTIVDHIQASAEKS